ncbi:MAG: alpha-E domain-containing protein [Acidimicrobiales bacterium]
MNFVTGAVPATTAGPGDIESELWRLLVDGDRPGAVAHSLGRMASAIDSVRDQMSVDTWVVVGSLDDRLQRLRSQPDHEEAATDALNDMLQGLLAFAGLSHESMVRDRAWHFTEAGRRIERAVGLVSLIEAVLAVERTASTESLILESLLTVGESIITYRRRYRSRAAVSTVLDLLLTDAGNPRSLRFQVDHLARALAALDVSPMVSGAAIDAVDDIIRLVDGLSCAKLATPNQAGSRVALTETCRVLLGRLRDASDALSAQYFIRSLPQHSLATRLEPSYTPGGQP